MQSELECVRCLLENPREEQHGSSLFIIGTNGKHELILTQSGIGKVSSAIRTYELIDRYAPDCILNTGVAGGIDRSMHVMDIVVGSEIVYHDVWCGEDCAWGQIDGLPARFHSDPALVEKALKVSTDLSLYKGLVCSGDRFITDPAELSQIKGLFPEGMAVDMESGSIAQVCYLRRLSIKASSTSLSIRRYNLASSRVTAMLPPSFCYHVPFLSFRIISDTPGVDGHIDQYNNFWENAPHRSFEILTQLINVL